MAKKIFALVVTVCVLGTIVAGCGSKADDSGSTGTGTTGTTTGK